MAVSHIMLEAYKKYILVSLILHGKVQQLPKYTSQIVGRFIKVKIKCITSIHFIDNMSVTFSQIHHTTPYQFIYFLIYIYV